METASIYKDTSKYIFKKICSLPLLQNSLYVDLHLKFPFQGKELFLKLFCFQNE